MPWLQKTENKTKHQKTKRTNTKKKIDVDKYTVYSGNDRLIDGCAGELQLAAPLFVRGLWK